jgi:hypothetical protein
LGDALTICLFLFQGSINLDDAILEISDVSIEEWGDHIFAHFDQGHATGGFVESANSVARQLNRMGRGYSLSVLRARLLYGWNRKRAFTSESEDDPGVDEHEKGVPISTLVGDVELPTS